MQRLAQGPDMGAGEWPRAPALLAFKPWYRGLPLPASCSPCRSGWVLCAEAGGGGQVTWRWQ